MAPRMLCTQCFRTAVADTLLPGSDRVEMLAWCALALPGLMYCWWRHALRIKFCGYCGSEDLVREARAAAARAPQHALPADGPRITDASGRRRWPRALVAPRDRLRHGSAAGALAAATLVSFAGATLRFIEPDLAVPATLTFATLTLGWLLYQAVRVSRFQERAASCRAWDASGRRLQIERVG